MLIECLIDNYNTKLVVRWKEMYQKLLTKVLLGKKSLVSKACWNESKLFDFAV